MNYIRENKVRQKKMKYRLAEFKKEQKIQEQKSFSPSAAAAPRSVSMFSRNKASPRGHGCVSLSVRCSQDPGRDRRGLQALKSDGACLLMVSGACQTGLPWSSPPA